MNCRLEAPLRGTLAFLIALCIAACDDANELLSQDCAANPTSACLLELADLSAAAIDQERRSQVFRLLIGLRHAEQGRTGLALERADELSKLSNHLWLMAAAALVEARSGKPERARQILATIDFPRKTDRSILDVAARAYVLAGRPAEALALSEHLGGGIAERIRFVIDIGERSGKAGRAEDAGFLFDAAEALLRDLRDGRYKADLTADLALSKARAGQSAAAGALAADAQRMAARRPNPLARIKVRTTLVRTFAALGRLEKASQTLETVVAEIPTLARIDNSNDDLGRAISRNWRAGRRDLAVQLAMQIDPYPEKRFRAYKRLAEAAADIGLTEEHERILALAAREAGSFRDPEKRVDALKDLAENRIEAGDRGAAVRSLEASEDAARKLADEKDRGQKLLLISILYAKAGNVDAAERIYGELTAEGLGQNWVLAFGGLVLMDALATAYREAGQYEDAIGFIRRMPDSAVKFGAWQRLLSTMQMQETEASQEQRATAEHERRATLDNVMAKEGAHERSGLLLGIADVLYCAEGRGHPPFESVNAAGC